MERRTERQTDESDFTGGCPTNVVRLIVFKLLGNLNMLRTDTNFWDV